MRKGVKYLLYTLLVLFISGAMFFVYISVFLRTRPPEKFRFNGSLPQAVKTGPDRYRCEDSWMRKNRYGIWEMYLQGTPVEIGMKRGALSKNLIDLQEKYFIDQINKLIPNAYYLTFLKYFVAWFNRDLPKNIPEEYLREIYGLSLYASGRYDYIGNGYERILNYHSAHDIGHALQDYMLVGCTSFAAWDEYTADSALIVGRNFDFYVGDDFAKDKIVCFVNPEKGYRFVMVTWAAMVGVSSGMNEKGLTVTINAAKSKPPLSSATPISILAREILQYAGNIEEAREIARKRTIFVSESLLISSAADHRAAIIEKSPHQSGFYKPVRHFVVCANHFQSETFKSDPLNIENIRESSSMCRFDRMTKLVKEEAPLCPEDAASILRDRLSPDGKDIGLGNEKSINQFIAHHSIIFKPENSIFWLAAPPWQMGPYLCYNVDAIFAKGSHMDLSREIYLPDSTIRADPFLNTRAFSNYLRFRKMSPQVRMAEKPEDLPVKNLQDFVNLNPEYFYGYQLAGDYFMRYQNYDSAVWYYKIALTKCISTVPEKAEIEENLKECLIKSQNP